jgi:peptide/nickel transport system substrate-binding protein
MKAVLGFLSLALAASVSAAGAQSTATFRQAHEIGSGDNSSLDPISRGRVFQVTEKIMSRLVRPGLDGKPAGDLAASWTSNAEATEWTFKLRPNVKFHDGKSFTADDVVYTLKRIQDPKEDSPVRPVIAMIEDVSAVDPLTVKMKLKQPFAELPLQLTDYRIVMIPVDSGPTIKTTGIGTGPFKLEKFEPRGTTVLVANPDYWEGAPGVAKMEIIGIADAQARFQALLGGQVDMMPGLTRQQRPLLERSGKHAIQEVRTGNWRGIVFRADVKPFDDVRVRKAVRLAVDRNALLNLVVGANGGVVGCDTPVGPRDQYRSAKTCAADVEGAKKLLAEAVSQRYRIRSPCEHRGICLADPRRGVPAVGGAGRYQGQDRLGAVRWLLEPGVAEKGCRHDPLERAAGGLCLQRDLPKRRTVERVHAEGPQAGRHSRQRPARTRFR